jgi:hypothetical protein
MQCEAGVEVIGAGGFGIIVKRDGYDTVTKLFRQAVTCIDSEREFGYHLRIYAKFNEYMDAKQWAPLITIPKPLDFIQSSDSESIIVCGQTFKCQYIMEEITSSRVDKIQEHVLLNEDNEVFDQKIMCKSIDSVSSDVVMTKEMKAECEPRMAVLTRKSIDARGLSSEELGRNMGILYQIVLSAGLNPKDAEFALQYHDGNVKLAMYDFRMAGDPFDEDDSIFDIYIPQEGELADRFREGRDDVIEVFGEPDVQSGGGWGAPSRVALLWSIAVVIATAFVPQY